MPRAAAVKQIVDAAVEIVDRCVVVQSERRKSAVVSTTTSATAADDGRDEDVAVTASCRRSSRMSMRAVSSRQLSGCYSQAAADRVSLAQKANGSKLNGVPVAKLEPIDPPLSKRPRRIVQSVETSAAIKDEPLANAVFETSDPSKDGVLLEASAEVCLMTSTVGKPAQLPATVTPKQEVNHYVGAHVSAAGGLHKAVLNAKAIGCRAFALFLKSQRQWAAKPLDDETAAQFRKAYMESGYAPHLILPHGSYLLNCGSPDDEVLSKSRATLLDELQRCEKLGLPLYNFHPGSSCGEMTTQECIDRIAESINYAHSRTSTAVAVIENMSCQGHTVGGTFEEIALIIDKIKDKSRVGVCIDTCHAFAAGYDISSEEGYEAMITSFDTAIGLKYLKGMHLNDSKGAVGCHLDRHANIGKGCIGMDGFKRIMNDPRLQNIPLILETPYTSDEGYADEIRLLYSLSRAASGGHCSQPTSKRRKQTER